MFANVNGVVCVDVEGRSVFSGGWGEAPRHARERLFIAKIEMAMRCKSVVGREVRLKCCGVLGGCVGVGPGVRPCLSMV